jgi:hypothetical protein
MYKKSWLGIAKKETTWEIIIQKVLRREKV